MPSPPPPSDPGNAPETDVVVLPPAGPEAAEEAEVLAAPVVSAFDRVQSRPDPPPSRIPFTAAASRGAFWRVVAVVAALAVGIAALVWLSGREQVGDTDLLARLGDVASGYQPALLTVDPAQAERYIEDASGWLIEAPELPGHQLVGVGFADLSPQASVPAFRYDSDDGGSTVVFAYDYVFLDSIRGSFSLGEAVYAGLAEDEPLDTRRRGDDHFVSWRRRAVIFTAVTESESAFEQIGLSVAS